MEVRMLPGMTLQNLCKAFAVPLELLEDSNKAGDSQGCFVPGYSAVPLSAKCGEVLEVCRSWMDFHPEAFLLVNGEQWEKKLKFETVYFPSRIESPIVLGRTAYDSRMLERDIAALKEVYPFIRVRLIGRSVHGRPIRELLIGRGNKKVHFNASFHANEWITTPILMSLLNGYLLALTNGADFAGENPLDIYNNVEISAVPMVNPDGVDLVLNGPDAHIGQRVLKMNGGCADFSGWKANSNGVDLNNQFPANWAIEKARKEPKAPAPRDYPGEAPLTEPEAMAMANLAKSSEFAMVVAFHTQGEEFYWGYGGKEPPEAGLLAVEFERKSGYRAVRTIDSHAGFKDWFIQEYRRPGFTIELGKGINPLPLSQFEKIVGEATGIVSAALSGKT